MGQYATPDKWRDEDFWPEGGSAMGEEQARQDEDARREEVAQPGTEGDEASDTEGKPEGGVTTQSPPPTEPTE